MLRTSSFYSCYSQCLWNIIKVTFCCRFVNENFDIEFARAHATRCKCNTLEFGIVCMKSKQGYPFNLPDRHLFTRLEWTGQIATPTTSGTAKSFKSQWSRNAECKSGLSLRPGRISARMFYCLMFTFDIYTNQLSRPISSHELWCSS